MNNVCVGCSIGYTLCGNIMVPIISLKEFILWVELLHINTERVMHSYSDEGSVDVV